jgi:hypothetical protein
MTATARFVKCPACGTPYMLTRIAGKTLGGHPCTQPQTLIEEPGPGVQIGRHLGALSNTSGQATDETGFCDGGRL